MSIVLWPRQEVLQLVVPQLANAGTPLSNASVELAIKTLQSLQTKDNKISFDSWNQVAKDVLKWNNNCITYFWDILFLAVFYLTLEFPYNVKKESLLFDIECVAIFLSLHIPDPTDPKAAPTPPFFESIWPGLPEGENFPPSPIASPSSPSRDSRRSATAAPSSPISPRSPKGSPQHGTSNSSPKRSVTSKAQRTSTQYLHSMRFKIPFILQLLNSDSSMVLESNDQDIQDFQVTRRVVNALGLIICGGYSRDQSVNPLSALHPLWSSEGENYIRTVNDVATQAISAKDLIGWINTHLSMNDLLYPATSTPSFSTGTPEETKGHQPQKLTTALASLSRYTPTVINSSTSTIIHVVTSGPSRVSSFRRANRSQDSLGGSNDKDAFMFNEHNRSFHSTNKTMHLRAASEDFDADMITSDFGISADALLEHDIVLNPTNESSPLSPLNHMRLSPRDKERPQGSSVGPIDDDFLGVKSIDEVECIKYELNQDMKIKDNFFNDSLGMASFSMRPELSLPQLFINHSSGAKMYLISPYYSASVTGCSDSQIILGAVYGAVVVSNCSGVKITCICRKLVVVNCYDCEFNIATLSTSVISGDSRNIRIGPHNASYRNLRHHLKLVDMTCLQGAKALNEENPINKWNKYIDINTCLSSKSSDSFLDFSSTKDISSVDLINPEEFTIVSIPIKSEFIAFEFSPISCPVFFTEFLKTQKEVNEDLKNKILSLLSCNPESKQEIQQKLALSSAISKGFMDWLVSSDHIKEVLDLVRIDSDKSMSTHQ